MDTQHSSSGRSDAARRRLWLSRQSFTPKAPRPVHPSRHFLIIGALLAFAGLSGVALRPAADPTHVSGRQAPGMSGYLHTDGAQLVDASGRQVRLTGVNWFGLETCAFTPHGLWARNWVDMMRQIVDLGFNTIRLPFSSQLLDPGSQPNGIDYTLNPDLQGLSGLQIMDKVVAEAQVLGLKVILDRHRPDCGGQSPLWYTDHYSEARWIADWVMLAKRYAGNDAVIGADLHNEPHGPATWGDGNPATDWRLAAERAGNAILSANPNWLIVVEGVEHIGTSDWYWWGGNLANAGSYPVQLTVPNRLVYQAHDYGPEVSYQSWFNAPDFPRNMTNIWDQHWGYLQEQNIAPVLVGEFGGKSVDSGTEGTWIHTLMSYIHAHQLSYTFWCLNPNSGDTGGLLEDDWKTVNPAKMALLHDDLAPVVAPSMPMSSMQQLAPAPTAVPTLVAATPTAVPTLGAATPTAEPTLGAATPAAPSGLVVLYADGRPDPVSNNPAPNLRIVNNGDMPVALSDLEARYYFTAENLRDQAQILDVDWSSIGAGNVLGTFIHVRDNFYYLQVHFSPGAGQLAPNGGAAEIKMRIHKPDWSTYDQTDDFSYGPPVTYTAWPRVALLARGQLVWGAEGA